MRFLLAALLLLAYPATAQMIQSGPITRGHVPYAIQGGQPGAAVFGDGGSALDGKITELGITGPGTPFCINDKVRTGPYRQLCLSPNALGGGLLSYNSYGGASPLPFNCMINGTLIPNCFTGGTPVVSDCPSILAYGGSGDNTTDNVPAWNAAIAQTSCISFPPGTYLFSDQITYAMPNALAALTLSGSGSGLSRLRWANGNGLKVTYISGGNSLHVNGLSFQTDALGGGIAVDLVATFTEPSPEPAQTTFFDFVSSGTGHLMRDKCWGTGVRLNYVSNVNWSNVSFSGCGPLSVPANYTGVGIDLEGGPDNSHIGIIYNVSQTNFQGLSEGIHYGSYIQGLQVSQANFTPNTYGIHVPTGRLETSQLSVVNSQFGFNTYAVFDETGVPISTFTANTVYSTRTNEIGFYLPFCTLCVINSNVFVGLTKDNTIGIKIDANGAALGGTIQGNVFYRLDRGIVLGEFTTRIRIAGNQFNDVDRYMTSLSAGINTITGVVAQPTSAFQTLLSVTGAVDNGSGNVRLTLSPDTSVLVNGQMVFVSGVGGVPAVETNAIVPILVEDNTHITLYGAVFSGSYTGGGRLTTLP